MDECWRGPSGCLREGDVATIKCFECIFQGIINVALRLGGILVLVMLIVGGFSYLTAGGDPKKAQLARNILTYAVLGLVLLILVWFILLFIEKFTGVPVTVFRLDI
ncbi:hypothetical protein ACFL0Y_04355 [Patescibacteria group bacterium]